MQGLVFLAVKRRWSGDDIGHVLIQGNSPLESSRSWGRGARVRSLNAKRFPALQAARSLTKCRSSHQSGRDALDRCRKSLGNFSSWRIWAALVV